MIAKYSSTNKAFDIRIEQWVRDWVRTWVFFIDKHKAKHEGFDVNTVSGSMSRCGY